MSKDPEIKRLKETINIRNDELEKALADARCWRENHDLVFKEALDAEAEVGRLTEELALVKGENERLRTGILTRELDMQALANIIASNDLEIARLTAPTVLPPGDCRTCRHDEGLSCAMLSPFRFEPVDGTGDWVVAQKESGVMLNGKILSTPTRPCPGWTTGDL